MAYIGNTPGVSSQRVVLEEVVSGSAKSNFTPISGYTLGYVDVLLNGVEVDSADFTATDGVTVTLTNAAQVGDTVKIKTWLPRGLSDGYLKSEADARFLKVDGSNYITGNVGIGLTPSAWGSAYRALQFNSGALFSNTSGTGLYTVQNTYFNGTNWIGSSTAPATIYTQSAGVHSFFSDTATSGSSFAPTERLRIDASGNVGIGTTSPASIGAGYTHLEINGTATGVLSISAGGTRVLSLAGDGTNATIQSRISGSPLIFYTNAGAGVTERMRILSNGNIGIGTDSPQINSSGKTLHIHAAGTGQWALLHTTNGETGALAGRGTIFGQIGSDAYVFNYEAGNLILATNSAERARIDASGIFYLAGTTQIGGSMFSICPAGGSAGIGLRGVNGSGAYIYFTDTHVNTTPTRIGHVTNINQFAVQVNGSGGVYMGGGATGWSVLSDERLKDIIEPITDAVSKVGSLRAVIGKYKTDEEGTRRSFLIAQDVQAALPEAISETTVEMGSEEMYLGVQYTDVIPLLVAAVKELNAKVEAQAQEIQALKEAA